MKGIYCFDNEVMGLCLMDKDIKDASERWGILVVYKNGNIMKLSPLIIDNSLPPINNAT